MIALETAILLSFIYADVISQDKVALMFFMNPKSEVDLYKAYERCGYSDAIIKSEIKGSLETLCTGYHKRAQDLIMWMMNSGKYQLLE